MAGLDLEQGLVDTREPLTKTNRARRVARGGRLRQFCVVSDVVCQVADGKPAAGRGYLPDLGPEIVVVATPTLERLPQRVIELAFVLIQVQAGRELGVKGTQSTLDPGDRAGLLNRRIENGPSFGLSPRTHDTADVANHFAVLQCQLHRFLQRQRPMLQLLQVTGRWRSVAFEQL